MNAYGYADKLLEILGNAPVINDESFTYIKSRLEENQLVPDYSKINMLKREKSDDFAYKYRLKGNQLFRDRKYFNALCAYNESLCYAPTDSESMGLAFSNRSAVYLEVHEFNLCKENIALAKEFKYPNNKFGKLKSREKMCSLKEKEAKPKPKKSSPLCLGSKSNPKYPFIVDCLKLRSSSDYGRHIITDRTLQTGEVIAIEKPFSGLLLPSYANKRCTNCLGQFLLNLLPCPLCTLAMFCSQNCMNEANEKFHRFECEFSSDFGTFFTTSVRASLRIFFEGLHIFNGSFLELQRFCHNKSDLTIFDANVKETEYRHQLFAALNGLCTNELRRSPIEQFRRAIVCTILCDFMEKHSKLSEALKISENLKFFMNFMFKHTQVAESNFHELYALSPQKSQQDNEQFGVGAFPFSSLLNHSCAPNVIRLTFNGFNFIIVSRRIDQGEQIFDNYGFHHALHSLRKRQHNILERYQFLCKCQACNEDFPLFEKLSEFDETFDDFIGSDLDGLENFTELEARIAITKYSKYIDNHSKNYPCYEISILQECLLRCFRIFEKGHSGFNEIFVLK